MQDTKEPQQIILKVLQITKESPLQTKDGQLDLMEVLQTTKEGQQDTVEMVLDSIVVLVANKDGLMAFQETKEDLQDPLVTPVRVQEA